MSIFPKKYSITTWNGKKLKMTAYDFYKRIMQDSKSDYNWITSATEIVRICNEPTFPHEFAQAIKIAILNCFSHLELQKEYPSFHLETDASSVYFCYNSLSPSDDPNVIEAKKQYLNAILDSIIKYDSGILSHHGKTYTQICNSWKTLKFEQYFGANQINFASVIPILKEDFKQVIKAAEEEGAFQKDKEEELEILREIWKSLRGNLL